MECIQYSPRAARNGMYPAHSVCRWQRHTECAGYIGRKADADHESAFAGSSGLEVLTEEGDSGAVYEGHGGGDTPSALDQGLQVGLQCMIGIGVEELKVRGIDPRKIVLLLIASHKMSPQVGFPPA